MKDCWKSQFGHNLKHTGMFQDVRPDSDLDWDQCCSVARYFKIGCPNIVVLPILVGQYLGFQIIFSPI